MSVTTERAAARLLLAAIFTLFYLYSVTTPLFEASDELWHYPLVQYLASGGGLPVQRAGQTDGQAPWRQEGSQPPLYYALAAIATAPIDASNWRDIRQLNPHSDMGRPTADGNANTVLHGPGEQFPWTRAALAVHVARLLSAVLSTLTVLFAYLAAREVFPRPSARVRDPLAWVRLGSMAFVAGVPMFAFVSGSVNNDNAAAMFTTLGLWWALRLARRGDVSVRTALVAGGIGAAAALSKSSALGLLPVFGLAALLAALRRRLPVREGIFTLARFGLVFSAAVAVLAGWWFVRNQQLYGDWLGWNAFLDVVGRRYPPATLAQLWSEREGFVWAYWGVFGAMNVILPPALYTALNGVAVIAGAGLLVGAVRDAFWRTKPSAGAGMRTPLGPALAWHVGRHSSPILCATWLAITFTAFVRWTSLTPASQGRLLFPCIAVIAMAMAYGLHRLHRFVLGAGALGLLTLTFVVPFVIIAPAYEKPTDAPSARPANLLNVTFGNALELVGYGTPPSSVTPGEDAMLALYWRTLAPTAAGRNYSVFVHLLNDEDVIVGQRDMYPGQGSLATSQLVPGYAWQDRYAVRVPPLAPAGQSLRWAVGVYDLQTGQRLTVTTGIGTEQGVVFGKTALVPNPYPNPQAAVLLDYGNGIVLDRYEVSPVAFTAGLPFTVSLHWRATRRVGADYTVSLQLIDANTNKVAQHDSAPVQGNAPTTSWAPGTPITDTHQLQVSPGASPGVYRLLLVLYRPGDASRLGAYGAGGVFIGNEVELESLRVK